MYEPGIAGANAWAADQDFGTQASDWGTDAAKEIVGQFTDPFGLSSLSDRAIDDLRTAAEALEAAQRQQQGADEAAGEIVLGYVGPILPTELDSVHMDPVEPMPVWEKGMLLRELTEETVDALLAPRPRGWTSR